MNTSIKQNLNSISVTSNIRLSISESGKTAEDIRKTEKVTKSISMVLVYAFLFIMALIIVFPFYWMIITSLKQNTEIQSNTQTFFPNIVMWSNYVYVFKTFDFFTYMKNTIIVAIFSTAGTLITTVFAAFAFSRLTFKGRDFLFMIFLMTMMIPGEMYTITNYLTVSAWGWRDTFTVMILPFLVSVYYIYLLRNNFMQIPDSLYKAAKVDGLSDMGYLVKVMVPLTAPTLVSITLLKFIGTWNSYIWPRLVNSKDWQMVTNWVTRGFTDRIGTMSGALYGLPGYGSETLTTLKMAAVCMVSLPLFILFITCRKYIMHGVSKSGTKG